MSLVIPVKNPEMGKSRMGVPRAERRDAAWRLISNTVEHLRAFDPILLVNDDETAGWLAPLGAPLERCQVTGLNESVTVAYRRSRRKWFMVAHGDLAHPELVRQLAVPDSPTVWRDQHHDGTPLFLLPTGLDVEFRYGPGSGLAHQAALQRLGQPCRVIDGELAAHDVDSASDYLRWRETSKRGAEAPLTDT
jgi:2-phospho-L-lactate guanylyltransferase (CobY/MobA/RfbA family)